MQRAEIETAGRSTADPVLTLHDVIREPSVHVDRRLRAQDVLPLGEAASGTRRAGAGQYQATLAIVAGQDAGEPAQPFEEGPGGLASFEFCVRHDGRGAVGLDRHIDLEQATDGPRDRLHCVARELPDWMSGVQSIRSSVRLRPRMRTPCAARSNIGW